MGRSVRWAATALAVAGALLVAATRASAQAVVQPPPSPTPGLTTREQLNPAAQTEPSRRRRAGDLFTAPQPEECALRGTTFKFTLHEVIVAGAAGLSAADQKNAWADFAGREITTSDICEIRDRVAARLFRNSILARVIIPEQHITADGVVKLTVIEAQIVSVRFHGEIGPVQGKVEAILNHLRNLAPFNLDTAQRYLLLANDVPGVHASARLSHSTATDATGGSLDLDVDLSRNPFDVLGEIQNLNSKTLGPWSGIARLDLNSLTPLGEQTSLIAYSTLGNSSQEVIQAIEQARIGNDGLYAQASFAYGRSHPGGILAPLDLRGNSYVGTLEIEDPVIRMKRLNLTLGGGFDIISQTTDVTGAGVLTDDALRILWLRAKANARRDFPEPVLGTFVTGTADVTVDLRKGIDALGANGAGALHPSRFSGRSDAFVAREDGTFALRFEPVGQRDTPITLSAHIQAQWADRPLLAYEEQAIGNLTVGRGYDPDAASGDRVIAAEIKAEAGPLPIGSWLKAGYPFSIGPYGFYDIARVNNLDSGSVDVTVRSAGAGLEIVFPFQARGRQGLIHADVSYAFPLDNPSFPAPKPPSRVLFTLVVDY